MRAYDRDKANSHKVTFVVQLRWREKLMELKKKQNGKISEQLHQNVSVKVSKRGNTGAGASAYHTVYRTSGPYH